MNEVIAIISLLLLVALIIVLGLLPKERKNCNTSPPKESPSIEKAIEEITEKRKRDAEIEQYKEQQEKYNEIMAKDTKLNSLIEKEILKCESENIKFLLRELQKEDAVDELTFSEKEWLFNNGELRDESEIIQHEHELKEMYYQEHPEVFDQECKQTNAAFFLVPFVAIFILCMGQCSNKAGGIGDPAAWLLIGPFALFLALGGAIIGLSAGHKSNLKKAEEYHINNSRTDYEKKELNALKVGGVASAIYMLHHAKSNLDEIRNPDSWKEMK